MCSKKRIIVYGDLHGCLERFKTLREKIGVLERDLEICAGDVLGKGEHWSKLLQYLQEYKIQSVLGNHELNILHIFDTNQKDLFAEDREILKNLKPEDIEFIRSFPPFIKIDNLLVVHGGVHPKINLNSLSKQNIYEICQIRQVSKNDNSVLLDKQDKNTVPWQDIYNGEHGFVVYGHQREKEVIQRKHSLGLDTGCVHGGKLSAAIFTDTKKIKYQIVSV